MLFNFFPRIISLSIFIVCASSSVFADVLYRETFSFCGDATASQDAAEASQWTALAAGRKLGKIGYLKVSSAGSPNLNNAVASNPSGPYEGNALWIKNVPAENKSGLLIFTDEFTLLTSELYEISFEQKSGLTFRDENEDLQIGGAKIAIRINNIWYLSDQKFLPNIKNEWQSFQAPIKTLTFGTSPHYPGVGPKNPQDSGKILPINSRILSFGLFYPTVNSRIRIDNFTLYNNANTGGGQGIDTNSISCIPSNTGEPTKPTGSIGQNSSNSSSGTNGSSESTGANGSDFNSYDSSRICVNGYDSRTIRMANYYKSRMYPEKNSTKLTYLRNKIALNLATNYRLNFSEITGLHVGDFEQLTNSQNVIKISEGKRSKLSRSDAKLIRRYLTLGKINSDLTGPLLRPTLSKNRLATVGICNAELRKSIEAHASARRFSKHLKFVTKKTR